ncbi:Hypothetical_protein [Hexamita inflata]|uniref:Hypothetical_protein n=1 Tax=Hexamita inflata TaxID=28002 RepID=A0AA86Q623_9EUKA|nr:Hypothetical protein HINF_LOCUS34345 [Hexamita inflata]
MNPQSSMLAVGSPLTKSNVDISIDFMDYPMSRGSISTSRDQNRLQTSYDQRYNQIQTREISRLHKPVGKGVARLKTWDVRLETLQQKFSTDYVMVHKTLDHVLAKEMLKLEAEHKKEIKAESKKLELEYKAKLEQLKSDHQSKLEHYLFEKPLSPEECANMYALKQAKAKVSKLNTIGSYKDDYGQIKYVKLDAVLRISSVPEKTSVDQFFKVFYQYQESYDNPGLEKIKMITDLYNEIKGYQASVEALNDLVVPFCSKTQNDQSLQTIKLSQTNKLNGKIQELQNKMNSNNDKKMFDDLRVKIDSIRQQISQINAMQTIQEYKLWAQ